MAERLQEPTECTFWLTCPTRIRIELIEIVDCSFNENVFWTLWERHWKIDEYTPFTSINSGHECVDNLACEVCDISRKFCETCRTTDTGGPFYDDGDRAIFAGRDHGHAEYAATVGGRLEKMGWQRRDCGRVDTHEDLQVCRSSIGILSGFIGLGRRFRRRRRGARRRGQFGRLAESGRGRGTGNGARRGRRPRLLSRTDWGVLASVRSVRLPLHGRGVLRRGVWHASGGANVAIGDVGSGRRQRRAGGADAALSTRRRGCLSRTWGASQFATTCASTALHFETQYKVAVKTAEYRWDRNNRGWQCGWTLTGNWARHVISTAKPCEAFGWIDETSVMRWSESHGNSVSG